jgi:hypothetical protein
MTPTDPNTSPGQGRRFEGLRGLSGSHDSSDLPHKQVRQSANSVLSARPQTRPINTGLGIFGFLAGGF